MPTDTAAPAGNEQADVDRPVAMVVEGDDKIRAVTSEVLRREKFEVSPSKEAAEIVRLAKELKPAVLMIDIDLVALDLKAILNTLTRFRGTQAIMTILLCPPDYDEVRLNSLKSLGAFGILHRPLKRAAIVEMAAAALKASQEEQARLDAETAKRPALARVVDSNNSILSRQVICPFHEDPVPFTRYTLRTGKIVTETNFFDLTIYKSAPKGVDFCNYHLLAAIVCPRCLFSSIHAGYFRDPMDPKAKSFIFNNTTWDALRADAAARRQIAPELPAAFYTERRTIEQAILSYQLSLTCSKILFEKNRSTLSIEMARIGNTHLRIAHLKETLGAPADVIDGHYRDALNVLKDTFTIAEGPQVFRTAYQVGALALRFGEDKLAYQYLGVMLRSEKDKDLPEDQREGLCRYLPKLQNGWADRDMHRSPLLAEKEAA